MSIACFLKLIVQENDPLSLFITMKKFGYLSGLSDEIQDIASTVDCPAPTFIFDMGNVSVHLSNRTIITHIPTLPSPSEGVTLHKMPDISFSTPGIYSLEDISGQDTLLGLIKQLGKQTSIDRIISDKLNGKTLHPNQKAYFVPCEI